MSTRTLVWFLFCVLALLGLDLVDLQVWASVVVLAALVLAGVPALRPHASARVDRTDLVVLAAMYVTVVLLFRLAFQVFTTDNVLGLFLCFAAGLLLGVVGPVVYSVWGRHRPLRSLGLGAHELRPTLAMGVVLAAAQFLVTFQGYTLPAPAKWVPLLGMSLVVGLFEAVFFRGFVQGRLEASFGAVPAVAGAAVLYALYHVGYGMGVSEMWFLLALGVVYAVAFRLTTNVLIVWPLLTPMGAFFNNLTGGDIDLPWASLLGFADVAMLMAAAIWVAHRRERKNHTRAQASHEVAEASHVT
ncbi:CPBP family intramembrane glutamic endopeptidase [Fodinibacter luteus]|uniref:CPBP family intramembrane glutamic endopeptidase n=1 Tax=Fodinibacter luteus TaxID=552064 RepID=UPI0031EA0C7B